MKRLLEIFNKMTKRRKIYFLVFFALSIAWAIIIFGFSSDNAEESLNQSGRITEFVVRIIEPDFDNLPAYKQKHLLCTWTTIVRKTAHFCVFALLGLLTYFCVGCIKYLPHGLFVQAGVSIPFCVLFAITDEVHQIFVDGRACRLLDVGIDSCGALFGTICAVGISFVIKQTLKKSNKKA